MVLVILLQLYDNSSESAYFKKKFLVSKGQLNNVLYQSILSGAGILILSFI